MDVKTIKKDQYPFLLQQISQLPETMDVRGELPPEDYKYLCVIGSRKFSDYGRTVCQQLISGLKGYPVVIVSGLAIGIDSLAHETALNAGLKTIAFPGSGLAWHVLYPAMKRRLGKRIVESGGALISPFKFDSESTPWTFPVRNRLMAGISHATLIIEARKGSGTLLTAGNALEFSRQVFVVPGSIHEESAYGPHMMLRRGAISVTSSEEILESLDIEVNQSTNLFDETESPMPNLSQEELRLFEQLTFSPRTSTALMDSTGYSATQLNIVISMLELKGWIKQVGGAYKRAR